MFYYNCYLQMCLLVEQQSVSFCIVLDLSAIPIVYSRVKRCSSRLLFALHANRRRSQVAALKLAPIFFSTRQV